MFTVADRDHEVAADEDHDLAGLDDLAGQHHRFVPDVIDGLEDEEQGVGVPLHLGPLMGAHRVFHGQRVQAENVGHLLHLGLAGFAQAHPDEAFVPLRFDLAHLVQGGGVTDLAGQPVAVGVDGAVDERLLGRSRARLRFGFLREGPKRFGQCVESLEHIHLPSSAGTDQAVLHATRPGCSKPDDQPW